MFATNKRYHRINTEKYNEIEEKDHEENWIFLTEDEESHPECFTYVLIQDEYGIYNVACCHPDYSWYITNGEDSLRIHAEVVKWKKL